MKIGFTGTRNGMAPEQEEAVRHIFAKLATQHPPNQIELHHGDAIGADAQAARIAKAFGFRVVAHPGYNPRNPEDTKWRAFSPHNDEIREPKPFVARDHDIVDETERMVATPAGRTEELRSGTWTTVRYAKKRSREIELCLPNAKIPLTVNPPPRTNAIAGEPPLIPEHLKRGLR